MKQQTCAKAGSVDSLGDDVRARLHLEPGRDSSFDCHWRHWWKWPRTLQPAPQRVSILCETAELCCVGQWLSHLGWPGRSTSASGMHEVSTSPLEGTTPAELCKLGQCGLMTDCIRRLIHQQAAQCRSA